MLDGGVNPTDGFSSFFTASNVLTLISTETSLYGDEVRVATKGTENAPKVQVAVDARSITYLSPLTVTFK